GTARMIPRLDVKLEIVLPMTSRHVRVRQQDLTDSIRVFDGDRLTLTESTSVVVQLGQTKNVRGHLNQVGLPLLDCYGQGYWYLPPIVGRDSRLEAAGEE